MPCKRRKRQLVKLLVSMIMASNLQGCGEETLAWTSSTSTEEADGIVCQQLDSICSVCGSLHGHCDASNHFQVGREDGGDRELQEHNSAESRDCPFCSTWRSAIL